MAELVKRQKVEDGGDPMEVATGGAPSAVQKEDEFSPELLRLYYDRIFPIDLMCRWLSYNSLEHTDASQQLLGLREFSFTTGDDIYIRWLSFESRDKFKKKLLEMLPHKIDIGAIYSAPPADHKKYKLFDPKQRELIIDIDLTDYDFLEVDVKRLETCDRCWPLMALAMRVLDTALRVDFGFEHLLWIYSGRRGIHCWTCDKKARDMSNEVRGAVADYLGPRVEDKSGRMQVHAPMHPSLKRAYKDELEPFFRETMLASESEGGFGILESAERQDKLLEMLQDDGLRKSVGSKWAAMEGRWSGVECWDHLRKECNKRPNAQQLYNVLVEIVFTFTYPRLDVNVSKGMNHLLKSPWCAHPKTGRVCVPVSVAESNDFDPSSVPTLRKVAADLDAAASGELVKGKEISHTSLAQYEAAFDSFLKKVEKSVRAERVRASQDNQGIEF